MQISSGNMLAAQIGTYNTQQTSVRGYGSGAGATASSAIDMRSSQTQDIVDISQNALAQSAATSAASVSATSSTSASSESRAASPASATASVQTSAETTTAESSPAPDGRQMPGSLIDITV